MLHYWSLENVNLKNVWLTIGQFDGVHRGHQEIIRKLTAGAQAVQSPAGVITFFPHPAVVLGKREKPAYLTTPEERAVLLGDLGVDVVITHPFDSQVANTSAQEFMTNLVAKVNVTRLMVGHDFALGRDRTGDVIKLKELGKQLGYTLTVVPPVKIEGEVISSSVIRKSLFAGQVERAAKLLGRAYRINGTVIPGDGRGRTIGIPTANLNLWKERALPAAGVYVCRAQVNGIPLGAVTNIGIRPTFKPQSELTWVETHLLDFSENIYDQEIQLDFIARLRDEQRFPDVQSLVEQIQKDITAARKILNS
jgi:riboflavin kinase/FMN adenylyltransferase